MLLKRIFSGAFLLLFFSCTCGVEGVTVIKGLDVVVYRPNEEPVELVCNVTEGSILGWRVNGSTTAVIADIARGLLPDHTVNGSNLIVVNATNNTNYICVATTTGGLVDSDPVILYIADHPDNVTNILVDLDTVNVDDNNNNVSFTLNWDEPFANFDPIMNYTVTISCTDAQCPAVFTVTTTSASVYFITDLLMMTPLSVTASNTVGTSDPATVIVVVPDEVSMVVITCGPVDVINRCIVTWNAPTADSAVVAAPIYYNVSYSGENITDSSVRVDVPMAIIDLKAVDSDVNVNVTAVNVFGSGSPSSDSMDEIMASSLINTTSVFDFNPDNLTRSYSLFVTCEINPTSSAEYCEVIARNVNTTISNSALIPGMDTMVTVSLGSLECEQTYTIAAGGVDSATELVGPRIVSETVTGSACPVTPTISSVSTDSTMVMSSASTITPTTNQPPGASSSRSSSNTGLIIGIVCAVVGAILLILGIVIIVLWCYFKSKREKSSRATSPAGGGTGVRVHTLDRYGKPIIEGDNTDTGVELTGYTAKSPEFTVNQMPSSAVQTSTGPTTTFQGNDYQNEDKNRTPSAFVPEGSYDTLAPADEPNVPSAEVVPPAQNGQSNPGAPKLNYAELEQFTRKPEAVKKHEAQPASQYAVIDPKSLQGTYT